MFSANILNRHYYWQYKIGLAYLLHVLKLYIYMHNIIEKFQWLFQQYKESVFFQICKVIANILYHNQQFQTRVLLNSYYQVNKMKNIAFAQSWESLQRLLYVHNSWKLTRFSKLFVICFNQIQNYKSDVIANTSLLVWHCVFQVKMDTTLSLLY